MAERGPEDGDRAALIGSVRDMTLRMALQKAKRLSIDEATVTVEPNHSRYRQALLAGREELQELFSKLLGKEINLEVV